MKQAITVVALVLVALFSGCNSAEESAEAEAQELQRKIEALKKEKQEAASLRDAGLDAELAAAREQLQIALAALEKEGRGNTEGEDGPKAGEELLIDDAPRAVVVEEGDEIKLGLKLNGPLAPEPVALLDAKDHQIFFAELGKFGEWFETDSYGFVWQPAELKSNPAWRPYTRGRWVNSDQGWTWLSDEPFGWAVYHTAVGFSSWITDGSGCLVMIGRQRGWPGVKTTAISGGLHCPRRPSMMISTTMIRASTWPTISHRTTTTSCQWTTFSSRCFPTVSLVPRW